MKLYQTDKNGFLVGEVNATKCPLTGVDLIPAGAVQEVPPLVGNNKAAKFDGQKWLIVDDLQGVEYWLNGQKNTIKERGESLPADAELTEPQDLIDERERIQAIENAKADLLNIDFASIRAIREYIASKADAPKILKDREEAAQASRAKLK
jgi:hypothetical protein